MKKSCASSWLFTKITPACHGPYWLIVTYQKLYKTVA